jgi:hypothetical protein
MTPAASLKLENFDGLKDVQMSCWFFAASLCSFALALALIMTLR